METGKGRGKNHLPQCSKAHKIFRVTGKALPQLGAWTGARRLVQIGHQWVSNRHSETRQSKFPISTSREKAITHPLQKQIVQWSLSRMEEHQNPWVKPFWNLLLFKQMSCHQRMTQHSVTAGPVYVIITILRTAKENFEALPFASINRISSFSSHKFPSNNLALHINTFIRFCTSTCRIVRAEKLCFHVDSEGKSICFKKQTLSV